MLSSERPVERLTNPRADRVRKVASLAGRSARQRTGLFLAEGPQSVAEALRLWLSPDGTAAPAAALPILDALYYAPELLEEGSELAELISLALAAQSQAAEANQAPSRIFVRQASPEVLGTMGDSVTSQGVLAVCRIPAQFSAGSSAGVRGGALSLALCRVQDPGNVGTMVRTADAAGAASVVVTTGTADPFSPKAVRAAAGSLFHIPVVPLPGAAEAAAAARVEGMQVLAADGHADMLLSQVQTLQEPTLWLLGNEAQGLDDAERAAADALVVIPRYGAAESLNVAIAGAVCLYASAMAAHSPRSRS